MQKLARTVLPILFCCCIASAVYSQASPRTGFDIHVLYELKDTRTPFQTALFRTMSDLNNPVCLAVPLILLIIGWVKKDPKRRFDALEVAETIALSQLLSFTLKIVFGRLRPQYYDTSFVPLVHALNESFPSGHTTEAFAMATSIALLGLRWYFVLPAFIWAIAMGYARMYLGVHFPTDVLGGIVLGCGSAWLVWRINNKWTNLRGRKNGETVVIAE